LDHEEAAMQKYVLLSTLTAEGAKTMHTNPDRVIEVDREAEAFGCKMVAQYATLGPYDFVTVIEAPDNETVASLSIGLGLRGTVDIVSMPAMPVESLIGNLKKVKGPLLKASPMRKTA
jgi:uncharacterized protein with GYD domain